MSDRNLVMRILLQAQDKASAALDRVRQSGSGLAAELVKNQRAVRALESDLRKADRWADYQQKIKAAEKETRSHAAAINKLAAEISATGKPTQKQIRDMAQLEKASQRAAAQETKLKDESAKLGRELKKAGFDTTNFARAQIDAKAKIGHTTAQINSQTAALERASRAQKSYDKVKNLSGSLNNAAVKTGVAGAAITGGVGVTLRASMSEEDAMLDIVKQVGELKNADNSLNHGNIAKMRTEVQALSRELPLSTIEIMQLYAAGARMDVPRQELEGYVRTAAQAATAFDAADVAGLAENLGKINKNFKLSAEQGQVLADVINYLDDNSIAKGEGIIGFLNRVSGIAGIAKISEKNMAALGSTLMTMGAAEEEAGTAVSAIFTRLASAPDKAPVRDALKAIGMDAKAVQQGMALDAQATIMTIVDAVKALPEAEQISVLGEMVGTEHVKTMAKMVSGTEEWRRQIELANSSEALGSMGREFETRMLATSSKWAVFKNQLFNAGATGGGALHSGLNSLLDKGTEVLAMFNRWMAANPKTAAAVMKTVAVVGVALLAFSAVAAAIAAVIVPMAALKLSWATLGIGTGPLAKGLSLLSSGFGGLSKALGVLRAAALAHPVLALIIGIGTALYLLWRHWDTVKAALIKGWDWLNGVFERNPILNFIFPFIGLARLIINNWDLIGPFFSRMWGRLKGLFSDNPALYALPFVGWAMWLINNWDKVGDFFSGLWVRLKGYFSGGIGGLSAQILNWSPMGLFYRVFAAVLNWFGISLPATLSQLGSNMVQKLIDGIKSQLPGLQSVWRGVARVFDGASARTQGAGAAVPGRGFSVGGYTGSGAGNAGALAGKVPGRGFSVGGYTGSGGINEPAGIVHKGEVVFSQRDVKKMGGWQLVERLRQGGRAMLGRLGFSGSLKQQAGALFDKAVATVKNPLAEGGLLNRTLSALLPQDDGSGNMAFALPGAISAPEAMRQAATGQAQAVAAGSRTMATGGNSYYITVTVPPGSNGQQIGQSVAAALSQREAEQQRRARSRYTDKD